MAGCPGVSEDVDVALSRYETMLLRAALDRRADVATSNWQRWAQARVLEDAPSPEIRLLPAVFANLKQVAPALRMPSKVDGLAKMTFAKARNFVFSSLDTIDALSQVSRVMPTKGLAMLIRFDTWSSRPIADIDVHITEPNLGAALDVLAAKGWKPYHGMTYGSLLHRSSLRRESWNFVKGTGQIDLHWRLPASHMDDGLEADMWKTAEAVEFAGRTLLLQTPEYAFITMLHHGFLRGQRSDVMQTIVDAAHLMPLCRSDELASLVSRANLTREGYKLMRYFQELGLSEMIAALSRLDMKPRWPRGARRVTLESALLRRPTLYRAWESLGRPAVVERFLLRWDGPFSKPLTPKPPKPEYDLRVCETIDEIAGPGWSWPEPDGGCFWSDRADARLLVPLHRVDDHLIVLFFDERAGLNPEIDVFVNGLRVARRTHMQRLSDTAWCLMVTRRMLFAPWVEISMRPRERVVFEEEGQRARIVPARRLRVLELDQVAGLFGGHEITRLQMRLLKREEPHVTKLARIEAKIRTSPLSSSTELPTNFDPLQYVLSYPDLFEHEVDPYAHYLDFGRDEGRAWH